MSKIHGMMDLGKRSMMNSQTAMQTVGHNIANKGTEGFSRQRVEIVTNDPVGHGKLRTGTGSRTAMVTRINNPYLEKQIGKERNELGFFEAQAEAMYRVEQVYNEQQNRGLNAYVSDFFNAFREFSNNPESLATRTQVKEMTESLTRDFKRVSTQLKDVQKDIDSQLETYVTEVNDLTKEIATLNQTIQQITVTGGPANDERDRRDLLVKQLGEKVNIRYAEGNDGLLTITAGNSAVLVAGYEAKELKVLATPETGSKDEGAYDIFYQNSEQAEPVRVTEQFTGGRIGALLDVRDKTVQGLLADNDKMAFTLATAVNRVHRAGYNAHNQQAGDFFVMPAQVRHYANYIQLDEAIQNDVGRIASGMQAFSPADNRIATAISGLQYENIMTDDQSTFDEFYNSTVGAVGVQTKRAESSTKSQKDYVNQLNNIRESISGVSLDEETTKLIEYQKAFDASARLIRTADEMFDTVLNLKRM